MNGSAAGFHLWLTVDTGTVFLLCLSPVSLPIILPGTIELHTVCHLYKGAWAALAGPRDCVFKTASSAALKPQQIRLNPASRFPQGRIEKGDALWYIWNAECTFGVLVKHGASQWNNCPLNSSKVFIPLAKEVPVNHFLSPPSFGLRPCLHP